MNKGNREAFARGLKNVNDSFEKAREWADLSNCLQKVKKYFDQNPGLEIPMKKDLAKRLAQCLNPDLNVIHQLTLEVYGMIFQRQIELMQQESTNENQELEWGSDLGLFYSGLFNFYQFAAFEVKNLFLQIIEGQILLLKKELLLSLPGFLICMLPALEDQNAGILKRVETILMKTEEIVGTSEFYGEVWKAMLRTPRTRLSAIKYMEKRIPKDIEAAKQAAKVSQIFISKYTVRISDNKVTLNKDPIREHEEQKKLEVMNLDDYFYFYYPYKEKLAINSLLAGLQDTSVYVNRGVLDFLITHMSITGNLNSLPENVKLVEGALITLFKKDFAFLKKFFTWFLSHLDEEDSRPSKDDPAIRTLVPAIQSMLIKYKEKTNQIPAVANQPILILQTLLTDNSSIIEPVLEQISVDLIQYVKYLCQKPYFFQDQNQKFKFNANVQNLFDMVVNQLHCVWMALGQLLSDQIRNISSEYLQESYFLEAIDLIDFCLRDLKLGEKETEKAKDKGGENFCMLLKPILSRLLSGVEKLSNYMNNLENAIPALNLIEYILEILEQEDTSQEDTEHLKKSIEHFNTFYVNMCNLMIKAEDHEYNEMFKLRFDTFKKSSDILIKIQNYSKIGEQKQMPEWLEQVIKCSETKRPKIVLVSIQTFLNILPKRQKHSDLYKQPSMVKHQSDRDYQKIQDNNAIRQLQKMILWYDYNKYDGEHPETKQEIRIDESKTIYQNLQEHQNTVCTSIIKTLWSLLDGEEDHQHIVRLLKRFDRRLPKIFSEVVIDELNSKEREVKVRAIKKFSIFWKLTAKDYPKYLPFAGNEDGVKYLALHKMLLILEDNDPTLRLSCKSWLSESKQSYQRILDPLIQEFLSNSKIFVTYSGQIFFYENYESSIVIQNFSKLRNIILNTQEEMIYFIMARTATDNILHEFDQNFSYLKKKAKKPFKCQNKYLQIIVYIALQFIMGQAVESVDPQQFQESQTVNASACEFMELILKSLEQHNNYSNEIAHIIIDPILKTFRQVIDNQNNAMQVHLLNLLKVIFFQCNFDSQEYKPNCERIFKDPFFIECIVKGMRNEVSFVRYHFIQFAVAVIPLLQKLIKQEDFRSHIKRIIECFCDLLKQVDVTLYANQHVVANNVDGQDKMGQQQLKATIVSMKKQVQEQNAQSKGLDHYVINQESDILQIFNGLESILYQCLGISKDSSTNQSPQEEFHLQQKSFQTDSTFGERIRGFFSTAPFQKQGEFVITQDQELKNCIYELYPQIFLSTLFAWNDLSIFLTREYFFMRSGVFPYTSEDEKGVASMIEKALGGPDKDPKNKENKENFEAYLRPKTNSIQKYIIEFLKAVADHSITHFIEGVMTIWATKLLKVYRMNMSKSMEKLLQILITLRLKPELVIQSVNRFIEKKALTSKKPPSKKKLVLEKKECFRESQMCHFLYSYLLYNITHQFKSEDNHPGKIYANVYKFIKNFYLTKHPSTICWLLEILFILSTKFIANDAYKQDTKLKKDYQDLLNHLLTSTASIISDSQKAEYQKKYGFNIAFPPTIYEILKRYQMLMERHQAGSTTLTNQQMAKMHQQHLAQMDEEDDDDDYEELKKENEFQQKIGSGTSRLTQLAKMTVGSSYTTISAEVLFQEQDTNCGMYFDGQDNVSKFLQELVAYISAGSVECPDFLISKYFKFFTIITLKQMLYPMVQNILLHTNLDKITSSLSIIITPTLQVLSNRSYNQPEIKETLTDFFACLMDKASQYLVKPYKREISELFFSDDFFKISRRTLKKWLKIINYYILDQKNEVFDDLVYKLNTKAGVFVSQEFEYKQKCIALKRLSFLVFSGEIDQYEGQLDLLLKKMTEGFKSTRSYKDLRIQLFLLTRVLLLRLKTNTLAEALRKLWPHLLNELVSIFEEPQPDVQLSFEAIKVIELMSCLNIEDFQMNQWIFLIDGLGMKFEGDQKHIYKFTSNQGRKKQLEEGIVDIKREIFQPFMVKFMQLEASFYNPQKVEQLSISDILKNKKSPFEQRKTSININPDNYNDDALKKYATQLQFHLNEANMENTEIDRNNAEAVIEKDFIETDKVAN